jgi:flavin-dependent dehydrogenase
MTGQTKVLVVGGGPAGSVAATAIAQAGLDVRLIEGATFPRYHIGESLTPSCRAVLEAIGIADTLDHHGFTIKYGGAFRWNDESWVFDWGKQVGVNSWQVDRSEFDALLLQHARDNGVRVTTGVTAKEVRFAEGRPSVVECRPADGEPYLIDDFDFLIDATGRNGLLSAQHFGNRRSLQNLRTSPSGATGRAPACCRTRHPVESTSSPHRRAGTGPFRWPAAGRASGT